jgi:uncharacterized protein YhfF
VNAKPVIFSAPMVRALLDGRKTQTRRIVRPQPKVIHALHGDASLTTERIFRSGDQRIHCPFGQAGDFLWVRETWAHYHTINHVRRIDARAFDEVSDGLAGYRADGHDTIEDFRRHVRLMSECDLEAVEINGNRWRPSIHMPRWASRITLKIYDVRVERLNAISEADARAEGAAFHDGRGIGHSGWRHDNQDGYVHGDARSSFARLWNGLHGPDSWTANPYVWAISFDVIRANLTDAREEIAA